jgi:hypothetical protein
MKHCCDIGSLLTIVGVSFNEFLQVMPPLVAIIGGSLGAYYYWLQIKNETRKGKKK